MYKRKKKIILGLSILCLTLVLCIAGPFLARNMYIHNLITSAKPVGSYDGKFAFLEMPSSKWYVRNLNIYDTSHPIGKQQVETFSHGYNKYDMKEIMWGNQSYDLFFWTDEPAPYVFRYDANVKQWVGPLYFDISRTEELRLQGIDDVYYFEPMGTMVGSDFLPIPDVFCQIPKQTFPAALADDIEGFLSK